MACSTKKKFFAVLIKIWLNEDGQNDHPKLRGAEVRPCGFLNYKIAFKERFWCKIKVLKKYTKLSWQSQTQINVLKGQAY
ncbi:MAG: hypothetical protein ONB46_09550 [candidate division KSB1 bacterium]|nr:hypothetical protein [candidate division KSB1 bacterium]MDZ7366047.1 hypothetical protein [candidate division KSB1 bacterium]MDZ7404164.1 hypothetical protein [candidate division KSB1 bacterium]